MFGSEDDEDENAALTQTGSTLIPPRRKSAENRE